MTHTNFTPVQETIVAFHIGRGGHYWNPGYLTYIGENKICEFTNGLFLGFENQHDIYKQIKGRPNLEEKYFEAVTDFDQDAIYFFENRLNMPLGEKIYFDCNGNPVGLTEEEELTGVGRINIDNDYDTTYTRCLCDCDGKELEAIVRSYRYVSSDILDYAKEQLSIFDEEETEEEEF